MLQFTRRVAAVAFIAHNPPSFCRCYAAGNALSKPLSIFVCAADEASDSAGAALVASLKQTFRPGVQLYGVVSCVYQHICFCIITAQLCGIWTCIGQAWCHVGCVFLPILACICQND